METIGEDELVMRVNSNIYHETCFMCFNCRRLLRKGDRFVLRNGKLYCEADMLFERHRITGTYGGELNMNTMHNTIGYEMINGLQSAQMSPSIDTQLAMIQQPRTPGLDGQDPYSPAALAICDATGQTLVGNIKSEPYSSSSNNSMASNSCNSNAIISTTLTPPVKQDGRRGPKRPRTILTTAQRRAFKASFEISQKPCRKVRALF